MPITLSGLRRYPVKSCRGEDLETALIEPWGLAGDRRWMVVDDTFDKVTAREHPVLLSVVPQVVPGGLRLTAPGRDPLDVAEPSGALTDVQIWSDTVAAADAGADAAAWFSRVLGFAVRLMFLDDPTRRPTKPEVSHPGDVVTFADAFPMLLASESSLAQLNEWIDGDDDLDIRRFRPNLVVSGAEAFAEDGWSRLRIGDATFRVVEDCSRCVLTTVHPDTLVRGHEPIKTLSRHRRWGGKVWFAVDVIPDEPGATLRVGDEVEVLDASRERTDPARRAV